MSDKKMLRYLSYDNTSYQVWISYGKHSIQYPNSDEYTQTANPFSDNIQESRDYVDILRDREVRKAENISAATGITSDPAKVKLFEVKSSCTEIYPEFTMD